MPTLAELAVDRMRILITCRCAPTIHERGAGHMAERYGGEITAEDLATRLRCERCGHRGDAKVRVDPSWNPQQGGPGITMGEMSAEYMAQMATRENRRRKGGRRKRLSPTEEAAIKAAAANLEKPKDV